MIALLGLMVLAVDTLAPFLPSILWAFVLSVALAPAYKALLQRVGGRNLLGTWIIGVLMALILVLPIFGLSRALIAFIPEAIAWVSETGAPNLGLELSIPKEPDPVQGRVIEMWNSLVADLRLIRDHFGDELRPVAFWLIREGRLIGTLVVEFALAVKLAPIMLHRADTMTRMFQGLPERIGEDFALQMGQHAVVTIR